MSNIVKFVVDSALDTSLSNDFFSVFFSSAHGIGRVQFAVPIKIEIMLPLVKLDNIYPENFKEEERECARDEIRR